MILRDIGKFTCMRVFVYVFVIICKLINYLFQPMINNYNPNNKQHQQIKRSLTEMQLRISKLSKRLPDDLTKIYKSSKMISKTALKINAIEEEWILDKEDRYEFSALNPNNKDQF